jgi:hypothetical protein
MARQQADLVVTGDVTAIGAMTHHMGPEVKTEAFGVIGSECVAEEQVTLKLDRAEKGSASGPTLAFRYNAPCFHPKEGFALVHKKPSIVKGDHLKAYLTNRDGKWWLIADELQNAPSQNSPQTLREQTYTGDYSNWPQ